MTQLTEKQIKTRWADIKKLIKSRPLLAYRVNIPMKSWDKYMHSIPEAAEVNRIYIAIQEDRKQKTSRLKEELSKMVGYRESKEFSRKSGVSDTSIRNIIEGKKDKAGYDIINRLELFVSRLNPDFEMSLENPLDIKTHTQDQFGEFSSKVNNIADSLKQYCYRLTEIARKLEKEKDWMGNQEEPSAHLEYSIKRLTELKNDIDSYWSVYIERQIK
ncbi:MAG: hypothetical protein N4A46_04970 [Schleiferiaceae bacterium]|jgi:hypothetical protein|nr:hypothetical protein [Schleiferiaceae bacterium]